MNVTTRSKEVKGVKARVAFKDVSNSSSFTAECAKQAKAVKSKQVQAVKTKSNKRAVSTIYEVPASKSTKTVEPVENERVLSVTQSVESKSKKPSVAVKKVPARAVSKPLQKTAAAKPTKSYQDGVPHDIDKRDRDDPTCVTDYVQDMYAYFGENEHRSVVGPYMEDQQSINERMRSILIDWLGSIHHKMKCNPETLYLTVNIIDRYLSTTKISRRGLQLVGVAALLIASKYEQIYPVDISDLVYVCDKTYSYDEIIDMEEMILKALNYHISLPTAHKFFVRYLNAAHADKKIVYVTSYVLESSLLSYDMMIKYKPSQLAAAAVLIARKVSDREAWSPTLLKYTGYREEDVKPVARAMLAAQDAMDPGLDSLKKKFSHRRVLKVASVALPTDIV